MEDCEIIECFNRRDESALSSVQGKYGRYLTSIAFGILNSREAAEECVNDALYSAWKLIPPNSPENPAAFFGKLVRNVAINRLRSEHALKRGGNKGDKEDGEGEIPAILEELSDTAGKNDTEEYLNAQELTREINEFLKGVKKLYRIVFVQRYWYCMSLEEIAAENRLTTNNVGVILSRTRKKLREHLKKGGYSV